MGNKQAVAASGSGSGGFLGNTNSTLEVDLSGKNYSELPQELKSLILGAGANPAQSQRSLTLSLAFNKLNNIEDLGALRGLRSLDVNHNLIASLSEGLLANAWPFLESINLSANKLAVLPLSGIADSPVRTTLTNLNLSNNSLVSLPDELGELAALRTFNISFNQIKKLVNRWNNLASLHSLQANNNLLSEIGGVTFLALVALGQLNLSHNRLVKIPGEIGRLTQLTKLYLNNNQIKELPPEMGQLRQLRELNLRNNKLTDLPSEMSNLWKLAVFDLEENPFNRDEFFQEIPEVLAFLAETPRRPPARKRGIVGSRIKQLQITANEITSGPPSKAKSATEEFEVQAYRKRLFQVKGKQNIYIREVECKYQSFNQGDVFVLDSGPSLFVWMGEESNDRERAKGLYFAKKLSEEECGSAMVLELDASNQEDSPLFAAGLEFWEQLGGKITISNAEEGGDDEEAEDLWPSVNRLFKVTEVGDRLDIEIVDAEFLSKEMLDHDHCLVLDCFSCTFVWAGTFSTTNEKSWAMLKAEELQSRPRPASTGVYWVMDGDERITFREQFWDWSDNSWENDIPAVRQAKEAKKKLLKSKTMDELLASPGNTPFSSPLQTAQRPYSPATFKSSTFGRSQGKKVSKPAKSVLEPPAEKEASPRRKKAAIAKSPSPRKKREEKQRKKEVLPSPPPPAPEPAVPAPAPAPDMFFSLDSAIKNEAARQREESQRKIDSIRREKEQKEQERIKAEREKQEKQERERQLQEQQKREQKEREQRDREQLKPQQGNSQERARKQQEIELQLKQQREKEERDAQERARKQQESELQAKAREEEDRQSKLKEEIRKKELQVQQEKEEEKKREIAKRQAQEKEQRDKQAREDIDRLEVFRKEIDARLDQLRKDFERKQREERESRLAKLKQLRIQAEKDRIQRDEKDHREREEAARKAREEQERKEREERERQEAEERAKREKEEKLRREREEKERKDKEERDRIAALEASETPAERRERQRREREERDAKLLQEQNQRLENARKEREEEVRKMKEDKERAAKERAEFMAKLEAERKVREERERQERLARRRALEASKTESRGRTTEEVEEAPTAATAPTARLKGPTRAAGPTRRNAATKNPIRALTERMAAEAAAAGGAPAAPTAPKQPTSSGARNATAGAFGLLWSLGADVATWKKRQEEKAARGETASAGKPKRVYHIKGRRNPFVREVECTWKVLNQGDVFVVDDGGSVIYQWNGLESNRIEKGKGLDFAKKLKDKEHAGRPKIVVLEANETPDDHHIWQILEKPPSQEIPPGSAGGEDQEAEKQLKDLTTLYVVNPDRVGASLDELELEVIEEYPLMKEVLDTCESYILDCVGEVFPWTGKKSSVPSRNAAVSIAKKMIDARTFWCAPIKRELEGGESVIFKEKFANWSSTLPIQMKVVASGLNTAPTKKIEKIDARRLHNPPATKEEVMIDDGSGTPQVWRVEGNQKVAISPEHFGEFHSGESYIILYKYIFKNKDQYLIYFWQGRDSSVNEKGTSALMTIQLDESIGGVAKEIRVVQNKEPRHFISIFKNRILIHKGKSADTPASTRLFQVGQFEKDQIKAAEVTTSGTALNSNNCFVCFTPDTDYVWMGQSSSPLEREFVTNSSMLKQAKKRVVVEEGKESADFWKALGGKKEYPIKNRPLKRPKRLFQCSIGTGVFEVHEIHNFCQDDLVNDDAMILDAYDEIYVWIGRYAHETEKKLALETAIDYAQLMPPPRNNINIPMLVVYQESIEPLAFTSHFFAWDAKGQPQTFDDGLELVEYVSEEYNKTFTYEELRAGLYPKTFDETKLENYMSDEEFRRVFGMTREEFAQQTSWKREDMKKALALY